MPGSTAEEPTKAKVTTANGVFVRPVAVAGIFRPAEDKPPALPEKRRFSALAGDLRPCSSSDKSDEFLRRRQSWDTRQKEVPFGQALLKKTPRNTSPAVLPEAKSGDGNNTLTGLKSESSPAGIPSSKQVSSLEQPKSTNEKNSVGENSSLSDEKQSIGYISPLRKNSDFKIVLDQTSNKKENSAYLQVSETLTKKEPDVNGCVVKENSINVPNSSENVKHPKKVYGLIKRDIKQDPVVLKTTSATGNTTDSAFTPVSISSTTDVTKPKPKVYGLSKANSKKESVEAQINQVFDKNVQETDRTIGQCTKEEQKCEAKNATLTSVIDKCNTEKDKELRSNDSPPKDFRPLRRTSDVIAAKIQNIFSKSNTTSTGKNALTLSKKSVTKIEGNAEIIQKFENSKSSANSEQATRPKSEGLNLNNSTNVKNGSDNSAKETSKLSINSKETDHVQKIVNFKQTGKSSTPEKSLEPNPISKKCNLNSADKSLDPVSSSSELSSQGKLSESAAVVTVVQPIQVDSKTKHSINATPSEDKKVDGKMPIKKTDQNSSDGTLLLKAPNQESDRKPPDSASSLSTKMGDCSNGAVPKKNFGFTINKTSALDSEKISKVISSSYNSTINKVQKIIKTDISRNGLVETISKKETSVIQNALALNSSVINKDVNNFSVNSLNSKGEINRDISDVRDNEVATTNKINKVEVTKITPSITPGIVPTVNVLFRTKSPQGSAVKEENRKKVVVETSTNLSPVPSTITTSIDSKSLLNSNSRSAAESVREVLKTVENVQKSLSSPKLPAKRTIVNLKNEEIANVSLSPVCNETDTNSLIDASKNSALKTTGTNENIITQVSTLPAETCKTEIKTVLAEIDLKSKPSADSESVSATASKFLSQSLADVRNSSSATCLYSTERSLGDYSKSISETKMSVVDLGDWNKKFQRVEPEAPRAPLRRRFQRESLPPCSSLRNTPSRFGSLKRIEDSPRYIPRSPSQSSLPQRYSYTEMLSKVCSMGVLPYVEPHHSKSCSSSSSQVSELWSELGEEQSTSTHASEMLEAETSERMRLEKEVQELQNRYSQVQQRSDKMEMEIMESRVYRTPELNGDISEDDDPEASSSLYKQKYERAIRDMEIMKRRMQQQHEEEMEQKSMLKKASDKRLAEALEDVEEERQVANQWKRKAQKLGAELQDLRLMLEEQMTRNGELEKKQRRFDSELSAAQEEIKKEKVLREKLMREKDQAVHEKYSLEQDLQASKIDSDMLHEKITQLNRELDELTLSSKGEEEVTQLKRAKQELERKNRDQEEELEELAAQVQMLEQAKLRLEMSLEKVRQEHRREASVREEEIEEIRASFSKKIKNLEAQLESEQDERHQLMKQKHELERCIYELSDQPPPQDPEIERRLRRDLKRTKALLRDAQSMLEHTREGQSGKTLIRQLKNQLEDSEFAKAAAVKARQAVEAELQECQTQLEEVTRVKNECESRCLQLSREKSAIQTQLEEAEEEMTEVMKKYKAVVAQMSIDQKSLSEQNQQIAELETERQMLKDQLSEVSHKFEHLATQSEDTHKVHRLDSKVRDLESKLELEQTTRSRLEHQITRLKEQNDRMREECDSLRNKELQAQEGVRRLQRQIRDLRDDYANLQQKEAEAYRKQHELEMALENTETDLQVTKNDLRLALQRIQDLQNALEDDLDSGTDVPDDSGSDSDSSLELSVLRNSSVTPVQRCESVASNLSYDTDGPRSRTSSFSRGLSAFGSRNDVEKDINGFSGLNDSSQLIYAENDEKM